MKIIQINAWTGHLLQPLVKFIESEQADIVCVQEIVSTNSTHSIFNFLDALEVIKNSGQYEYTFFAPTFSFSALGEKVKFGNAILSRIPLDNQQTVFINGNYAKNQTMQEVDVNTRNLQICTFRLGSSTISLANHHGFHDLDPRGTETGAACMKRVAKILKPYAESLIFCGDLNVSPDTTTMKELDILKLENQTILSNQPTTLSSIHQAHPISVICDYIMTSKNIIIKYFTISEAIVSDHKVLILEFEI